MASDSPPQKKIAIFLPSLTAGGVARVMLQLAHSFVDSGHTVDLLLCRSQGEFMGQLPSQIRVLELKARPLWVSRLLLILRNFGAIRVLSLPILFSLKPPKSLAFLPDLIQYLRQEKPNVLLAAKTHTNLVALWATQLAKGSHRVVISERTTLVDIIKTSKKWRWRFILPVLAQEYPKAGGIITVSNGVKEELVLHSGLPPQTITTIYNPLLTHKIREKSEESINHPWFQKEGSPPIILGVGRLVPQKDFSTLVKAFSHVRQSRPAHLVIIGEGRQRSELTTLAQTLGIDKDVWMPGFSDNPYAFMGKASILVLSSIYEGLPNVLIEALACGCPIVSTDCPSGPSEILEKGKYGTLVPMGDSQALAQAIHHTLDHPPNRNDLLLRAADFAIDKISSQYLKVLLG
ncbi:MAG: glycosyltransferase [Nitrospirota bacterium]|nr:glycosyltransferase [Nitrospirota bacterium]